MSGAPLAAGVSRRRVAARAPAGRARRASGSWSSGPPTSSSSRPRSPILPPVGFTFLRFSLAAVVLLLVCRWREGSIRLPRPRHRAARRRSGSSASAATRCSGDGPRLDERRQLGAPHRRDAGLHGAPRDGPRGRPARPDQARRRRRSRSPASPSCRPSHGLTFGSVALGDLLTLAAAVAWAIYVSLGAGVLRRFSALGPTTWTVAFGTLFLAPLGLWQLSSADLSARRAGAGRARSSTRDCCRRPSATSSSSAASRCSGRPGSPPPVPAAGPGGRVRGGLPRRADPRRPGRRRLVIVTGRAHRPAEPCAAARDGMNLEPVQWPSPPPPAMGEAPAVGPLVPGGRRSRSSSTTTGRSP